MSVYVNLPQMDRGEQNSGIGKANEPFVLHILLIDPQSIYKQEF